MQDFKWTLNKSIALVGIMGAGKSHLGRMLSKALSLPFIDTDQEIVEAAGGYTIQEVYDMYGYKELTLLEERILKRVMDGSRQVVSTGDGVFVSEHNRKIIKKKAVSIWLRADLNLVLKRTNKRDHRPLLNTGNPEQILEELIHERYPLYSEADLVVDSENVSPHKMMQKVLDTLEAYQNMIINP